MNDLKYRVEFALPIGEKYRATVKIDENGMYVVTLDVHGLKCTQAKKIINNLLNAVRQKIRLIVIHGFNHGTAIKEMLPTLQNNHIVNLQLDELNPGKTFITAA